ncbi:MAG: bile acid:sodium symporter [Opitutaceae bacterium]|nr:bile acid:sodium symporter [Opitutaceae bacterium]
MKFKFDWFLTGLAGVTVLAWLIPGPGAAGGWMHPELLTKAGIALIFFLHGLVLSFVAMRAGALNWRLHLLVQASTFLIFPLLGLLGNALLGEFLPSGLKLGFFYLCALPSTVSSSVAMTATAGGNVAGAVFNATLSSVIGVVLTPLWVGVVLHVSGQTQSLGPVILDLVRWLVLPLAIGQAVRPWLGAWAERRKAAINVVDRVIILLLVYTSFCDSFKNRIWSDHGGGILPIVLGGSLVLFVIVMTLTSLAATAWRFNRADRIAAVFCGSKKTLASGVPMAKLIFGAHPGLGLILLPIMIYHPLQLIICSVLAARWRKDAT